jgi:hypothetical protein
VRRDVIDIIAPADAFRLLLRAHLDARYGKREWGFVDKIKSAAWFRKHRSGVPVSVQKFVGKVLERFRIHIREGDLRLRGILSPQDPPVEIDSADCRDGDPDIFDRTLKIYESPQTFRTARTYSRVYCVKADVLKLVDNTSKCKPALKTKTPDGIVRTQITAVYDDADKGGPRPNIKQLPNAVQPRLENLGYNTSGRQIMKIGKEKQFNHRRRKPGEKITKQISRS